MKLKKHPEIINMYTQLKRHGNKGFTLIEMMIVVAIIGILSAIAYPSYVEHVRSANRADAQADLLQIASDLERYFTENNTYVGATIPAGVTSDSYTYTDPIPNLGITTYTLTAIPKAAQTADKCGTLTITQTGATASSTGNNCWR